MAVIVGVDLGVRTIHLSFPDKCITIETPKQDERWKEIVYLIEELTQIISNDTLLVIEEPVAAGVKNLRVFLSISQVSGAVLSTGPAILVPVTKWKKEIVGVGNASKDEVREWLLDNFPYDFPPEELELQDHVDATCIRLYGEMIEHEWD